ncbi:hypothetical protein G7Y89_g6597 [Cudoniella acicularis]|uniref:Uncharacterized protein n=1 Tax=Cudoniella acicularis TaxID=354080 RepID=A0A8H4RMP6_9HELO|nr:hypothetical protein G7Y89_g6597 [Cudoniella acicularis]
MLTLKQEQMKWTAQFQIGESEAGTFWYHSHSHEQTGDGLYGGLVIHQLIETESEQNLHEYDDEILFMIGDWYHHHTNDLLKKYLHWSSAGAEPVPDSILVNGIGSFNCSKMTELGDLKCTAKEKPQLQFEKGKKHRFRVINVGLLAGLTIFIPGSKITATEIDGGNQIGASNMIDGVEAVGILYPGQRMDLIVEFGENILETNLIVTLDEENFVMRSLKLTASQSFPIFLGPSSDPVWDGSVSISEPETLISLDLATVSGPPLSPQTLSTTADETFVLYTNVIIVSTNMNMPMGRINRTSWRPQESPPQPLISLDRSVWDANQLVPWTGNSPKWVDIILNNMDTAGHPFHLHGFSFFVLATCSQTQTTIPQTYNPFTSTSSEPPCGPLNLVNPPKRDTVNVPPKGSFVSAGATAVILLGRTESTLLSTRSFLFSPPQNKGNTAVEYYIADVADHKEVGEAFRKVIGKWGKIDVLVNNAGYLCKGGPCELENLENYWRAFEVNVKGPLVTTLTFMKLTELENGEGKRAEKTVINITSLAAHMKYLKGAAVYSASKLAVAKVGEYFGREFGEVEDGKAVRVFNVMPGIVKTDMSTKSGYVAEVWDGIEEVWKLLELNGGKADSCLVDSSCKDVAFFGIEIMGIGVDDSFDYFDVLVLDLQVSCVTTQDHVTSHVGAEGSRGRGELVGLAISRSLTTEFGVVERTKVLCACAFSLRPQIARHAIKVNSRFIQIGKYEPITGIFVICIIDTDPHRFQNTATPRTLLPSQIDLYNKVVLLPRVIESNERIASTFPQGLVTVFVGGTSGVGEYTLKAFTKYTTKPRVYIVGRSQECADRIIKECKQLNSDGKFEFIKADVSLLKNVDNVCCQIKEKETAINILFETQGSMAFKSKTSEGLPLVAALITHLRMRFILNLLPLLQRANSLRRIVSVLAATTDEYHTPILT